MDDYDIYFIRHAESQVNSRNSEFAKKLGSAYSWDAVKDNQEFLETLKYNPQLIDCPITQTGIQQAQQAKIVTDYHRPEIVIVSPLLRTLQTCEILFGDRNIPVFVEPILSEGLRSCCDISKSIESKKLKYPDWHFSEELVKNPSWFIEQQLPVMRQTLEKGLQVRKYEDDQQFVEAVLQVMKETKVYEQSESIRERAQQTKHMLKKYREKYGKIAIVAHYNTINYTVCSEFKGDQPVDCPHLSNCQIHFTTLSRIIGTM